MMCSGMVSPDLVVRALSKGADGVLVLGCHLGECHYMEGNFNAAKRMAVIKNLLAFTGIDPERLRVEWVSSAEAPKLVQIVTEFSNQIKALGPSPLKAVAC
jgi:F420-non-reducing hydrogenase iron-sulfur subunit